MVWQPEQHGLACPDMEPDVLARHSSSLLWSMPGIRARHGSMGLRNVRMQGLEHALHAASMGISTLPPQGWCDMAASCCS